MRPRVKKAAKGRSGVVIVLGSLFLMLTMAPQLTLAQCTDGIENPAIESATPSEDFRVRTDGTVLHRPTQLIWQRCAIGQSWTGTLCTGSAQLQDWTTALQTAREHEQADADDWRLPNRNELASIVETRCHAPAINGDAFPMATSDSYWTNSPTSELIDQVWVVLFADGEVLPTMVTELNAVRLVRSGRN